MNKIPVSQLKPNMFFDKPVYINGKDLLISAFEPLKLSDYERLKKWNVEFVYTDGKIINESDAEKQLQDLVTQITEKKAPNINELYNFSMLTPQETDIAKKHAEIIDLLKENFEYARIGKLLDVSSLKNAANTLISLIEKNKRIILKFVFHAPEDPNDYIYFQGINTAIIAILTGMELKYSRLPMTNLVLGAMLHDIGMTKIPNEIIMKKDKLTDLEVLTLRKHPIYGHKIIQTTNAFSADVANIILQHHEKMDGSGYPSALKGSQIIEYARITSICDSYIAMCSRREYREAMTPHSIVKTLLKEGIGKLDPNLLKIFVYTVGIYPVGTFVRLNNGMVGEVMLQNITSLAKPVVKVYLDPFDTVLNPPSIMNLAQEQGIELERVLSNEEKKVVIGLMGRK